MTSTIGQSNNEPTRFGAFSSQVAQTSQAFGRKVSQLTAQAYSEAKEIYRKDPKQAVAVCLGSVLSVAGAIVFVAKVSLLFSAKP